MRRITLVVFTVSLLGLACAHKKIIVDNTQEGRSCLRDCLFLYNQCIQSYPGNNWAWVGCRNQQTSCLWTCPGAHEE